MALVVDDPDAPTDEPFVHWLIWNIPTDIEGILEAIPREATVEVLDRAAQRTNDFGKLGYNGPCPLTGNGAHTYQFTIQLIDTRLEVEPGADVETFRSAVESHIRGEATIAGSYQRQ